MGSPSNGSACLPDDFLIDELLQGTSRTFALAIPLLKGETRRQIGLSYLLFRIADSVEDAPDAAAPVKLRLLEELSDALSRSDGLSGGRGVSSIQLGTVLCRLWPENSATHRLLGELPRLSSMLNATDCVAATAIRVALSKTIFGMREFLAAAETSSVKIQIQTVHDLLAYCYVVAGIVGEMLTDLFISRHVVSTETARELRRLSIGFGECLQLTNILKDAEDDVLHGRIFIPTGVSRETVLSLALEATNDAKRYIELLDTNNFPDDVLAFCRFLFLLAEGTLTRLRLGGETSKLTRGEVRQLLETVAVRPANVVV